MQDKRRLLNQVDSLELALQIKADEVKELKGKLEAEVKGRLEDQDRHEQVSWDPLWPGTDLSIYRSLGINREQLV